MMEFTRLIYSIIVLEVIFFCDSGVEPAGVFNILQDPMNLVKQAEKIITDARETFPTKIVNNIQPQTKPIDFNVVTEVQENDNKLETRSDIKPEEISNYVHHEFEIKGGGIQKIKLYTGPDLSGVSGELLGRYCWDLRRCFEVTLDNSVSSVLVTGLWAFYTDYTYGQLSENSSISGEVEWAWGDNHLHNFGTYLDNNVSSARFIGPGQDMTADSLSMFSGSFFRGREYFLVASEDKLFGWSFALGSLVVTGNSAWTLYEEPGFKGSSGCVYPPGGGTPKMLATPDVIGNVIGMEQIGSAKIGCHSRKILPQVQKSTASLKTSPLNYPIFPPFAVNLRGASPLQEFDENAATEKKNKTSNKK
ncbi:unnamed protein product [Notodromas monacha]|uniref:Uncharacterized protein n=1 Tax=Notodromas monacha TaxID=399045 RepID=A0A7R9BYD1_9CRUS|nr:unnamed protein product [Notodromas monacha]CAG0923943.1 unnamed protein product [Notodromas monacha]